MLMLPLLLPLPLPLPVSLTSVAIIAAGAAGALVLLLLTYLFADRILLHCYHVSRRSSLRVNRMVERLASKAGIRTPDVFIVDSPMPNAFTVSSRRRGAYIVLTTGLMELLETDEIEAVLAHELIRIKNGGRGMRIGTAAGVLAGLLTALVNLALWGAIFTGFGQEDDPAPQLIKSFVTALVAPIAATIVQLTTPHRGYQMDEQSVALHGRPSKLAGALRKIGEQLKSHHCEVNPAHAHLFFVEPLHDTDVSLLGFRIPSYHSLFRTHPATEARVHHLLEEGAAEDGSGRGDGGGLLRPLLLSFASYMLILFFIIAIDTFNRKDFVFERAAAISAAYTTVISIAFIIMLGVFRVKLGRYSGKSKG